MKNIFPFIFLFLFIYINCQNPPNNTTVANDTKKKEFNLTESLLNFFDTLFASNNTNKNLSDIQTKKLDEQKKAEEKKKEELKKLDKMEKVKKENEEKEKKRREALEKEREEFDEKMQLIPYSKFINLNLEGKGGETLYHNVTKPCTLKILFLLTDTERNIHLTLNGPNGKGGNILIQNYRSKPFLYFEYKAKIPGQYTIYLNNYANSDETEVIFALSDDTKKTEEALGTQNIDKISGLLNEIDININQMRSKQNIMTKKAEAHNDSVDKHNREILIYSIIEVVTMLIVFVIQTCYIKNIVGKL